MVIQHPDPCNQKRRVLLDNRVGKHGEPFFHYAPLIGVEHLVSIPLHEPYGALLIPGLERVPDRLVDESVFREPRAGP